MIIMCMQSMYVVYVRIRMLSNVKSQILFSVYSAFILDRYSFYRILLFQF